MKKSILAFITAFLMFGACMGVSIMFTKGIWIYYGDFNIQQIPFYIHLHDLIRSGNLCYDWSTDLGGSVLGCYSFYILGSPFFWLTIPFKSEWVPYLIPWINALKYGVMAFTSFLWLKRHTKTEEAAFMGALLYAFSGYSGAVLVYNHFHDVCALFPLWLLCFDLLMEKKKRIPYILMTMLMAMVNYYFFVGEAVFICIYFFCKYFKRDKETSRFNPLKLMWRALWCSGAGVVLSLWYLIPAIYYTMGNSRLKSVLMGADLVAYNEPVMLLGIIKNTVLLPDISGLNSMFNTSYSRVSGVGAYLPMISVACVIAYFIIYKGKDVSFEYKWPKRVLCVSLLFAFIPGLNALFSALNSEYYARWYFMPVLIMALVSVRVLETIPGEKENLLPIIKGNIFVTAFIAFFAICAVLPAKTEEGELTILGALKNPEQLAAELLFTVLMTGGFFVLLYLVFKKSKSIKPIVISVSAACFATCIIMFTEGDMLVEKERANAFIEQCLKNKVEFPRSEEWYRIETEQDVYNYPMVWNMPTNTSFISTISPSIIDFYEGIGLSRKVTSHLTVSRIGARTLFSTRYLIVEKETSVEHIGHIEEDADLSKFTLMTSSNGFDIYENNHYIPMGFSFDEYVTEEEFREGGGKDGAIDRGLLRFLILGEEDAAEYGQYMTGASEENLRSVTSSKFALECDKKREHACTDFKTSKRGFTATAHMERDNLLFFSVPYDECFTAYVDGVETKIVKADFGFSAVLVPEGDHDVEYKYEVKKVYKHFFMSFVQKTCRSSKNS